MDSASWQLAKNVLVVRLDDAGDLLLATPAIRAFAQQRPGRRITLLASKAAVELAAHIPEIADAIGYDAPWVNRDKPGAIGGDLAMRYLLGLRAFDAAAILTPASASPLPAAMLCYLAGIPLRLAQCREDPHHLLTQWARETEPPAGIRHEARRQLDLVATVGAVADDERLSWRVSSRSTGRARIKLQESGLDLRRPFVVVHPGAAESRRWAAERFADAAAQLALVLDVQVVVTGPAGERELAERVRRGAGPRAWSLAGRLSLDELAAVFELAPMLLSDDPAAMHLAAAVRTPVVGVMGSMRARQAPWMVAHRLLPLAGESAVAAIECTTPDDVTVADVVDAAGDLWLDIHWRAAA